mmetsp:Transcript_15214/g.27372  ORF Transcript_15214/g.27372 Transcript_15214/m.27372 type:complete len:262 (+) Transcript_15214:18-803(+)
MLLRALARRSRTAAARRVGILRNSGLFGAAITWVAMCGNEGSQLVHSGARRSRASVDSGMSEGVGKIVLGSKSQTRQDILKEMGYEFEILPANIDEKAIRVPDPKDLVVALGHAKADAIQQRVKEESKHVSGKVLLITGDQVVVHEGRILEKPENEQQAREFIRGYGRSPPQTVGSVVVTDVRSGKRWHRVDTAKIIYKNIPEDVIDQLIKEGEIFYSAGGLRVEDPLVAPYLVKIEGAKDSIMGLCKADVKYCMGEACKE